MKLDDFDDWGDRVNYLGSSRRRITLTIDVNMESFTGWGTDVDDHVQSYVRMIQEKGDWLKPLVISAQSSMSPVQYEYVEGTGHGLVPIDETEWWKSMNDEEEKFVKTNIFTVKEHQLSEPSWKEEKSNAI